MSITPSQVLAKARAYVDALSKLPRSQVAALPHGHFARDYNTLRKLAVEALPDLDERLLGKYVGVFQDRSGQEYSAAGYVEIETYARQILEQFSLQVSSDFPSGTSSKIQRGPTNAGAPWTAEEDEQLKQEFAEGHEVAELSQRHGRTDGAIQSRLMRLGLMVPPSDEQAPLAASSRRFRTRR